MVKIKLLFLVNVDWFFISHRLPIALAAKRAGYDVTVAAADTGSGKIIESLGLNFIDIPFSRKGTNLFSELTLLPKLYRLFNNVKPDLVHQVTIKPILFGSLVARLRKKVFVVNAITGLGFTFTEDHRSSTLGRLVRLAYKIALGNPRQVTIFQNPDDHSYFIEQKYVSESRAIIIKGSGVDASLFKPPVSEPGLLTVLLASRMIEDKGVYEFVEAAAILSGRGQKVRFVLAGMSDDGNPNAIPEEILNEWTKEGTVEWVGHVSEMLPFLQKSAIVVLPTTYPEGVPKILIEAASCGKPIVTTDVPGCREIVEDGVNGYLVPPKNVELLAGRIEELIRNPELRKRFGEKGREKVIREFSEEIVVRETLGVYERLLGGEG